MYYRHMDYIPFDINNPHCLHVFLSNRVYSAIISEALSHGGDETGGPFIGYIIGRKWYILDTIDPGTDTIHEVGLFQWEQNYVNRTIERLRKLYRIPPTILGFWHRHPGSMDFFSQQDVESTQKNLQGAKKGLISMLVNIDPDLRMTFYYCNGPHFMPVRYDVGDEYFPVELLEYASPELLAQRHAADQGGRAVDTYYKRIVPPPHAPGMEPKKSVKAVNDVPPQPQPEPQPRPEPQPEPQVVEEPAAAEAPQQPPVTQSVPEEVPQPEPAAAPTPAEPVAEPVQEEPAQETPVEAPAAEPAAEEPAAPVEVPQEAEAPAPEAPQGEEESPKNDPQENPES